MRYINPRLTLTLPNFISILSPITIQFVVAFYSSFSLYFALYCVIVLFGLTATKLNKLYYYYYYYYYYYKNLRRLEMSIKISSSTIWEHFTVDPANYLY